MHIRELTAHTGVAERQVRYLIAEGFIPPPRGGRAHADYGEDHVAAIDRYARLRDLGFPPAAIKLLLQAREGAPFPVAPGITLVDPKLLGHKYAGTKRDIAIAAADTIAGGGGAPIGERPPTDPAEDQNRFLRSLAELKSRERPAIRAKRWTGVLREPIDVLSANFLEFMYGAVPAAEREWYYFHEERFRKMETLRAQLEVDTWFEVALWFAKREVPGFKIAPKNSKRRTPWRNLRVVLYMEVNALIDSAIKAEQAREGDPKAVEGAIARIKGFDPPAYRRYSEATLRKQYYLAKAWADAKANNS
jgi:MerR family transcriptional regulator, copper efflux regulator